MIWVSHIASYTLSGRTAPALPEIYSHLQILVSPSCMNAEDIACTIKIGYPGALIVAEQALRRMVMNMAESLNYTLTGDSVCSPDFAKCSQDDLDFSHLAPRVPAPTVQNKRKHIEKQVQLNKTSPAVNPTTPVAQPSQAHEPRAHATLKQSADDQP
ncbi:lysine specific demethylase 4c [Fusarium napiforme]|uniref:Lysine specific demethylase 4c n=1 Tax=Fusarium napiforme TaxID=42672 RepID=A0A8H5MT59_9HYPO|nr:lysine specific demethylase 4c [Fusarium napiforme]